MKVLYGMALSIWILLPIAGFSEEITLSAAFSKAKAQSESLAQRALDVQRAYAQYDELFAAILPKVHLIGTQQFRNSSNSSSSSFGGDSFRGSGKNRSQVALNVRQPLFSGFRDFLLSYAAKSEIAAKELDKKRAEELLYLDVAQAYYQTLLYEDDLRVLRNTEKTLTERVDELGKFLKLGKSKQSEILEAEAEKADTLATVAQIKGLGAASKELLAFLIGVPSREFSVSREIIPAEVRSVELLIEAAQKRADITSSEQSVQSREKQLTAAQRESWPVLSVEGNAYPYEHPDTEREWDILFKADIPLFEGGAIDARIAQEHVSLQGEQLKLREIKRTAEKEVRTTWEELRAAEREVQELKESIRRAEQNYRAQKNDYGLGVVTNLEVLNSIRQLESAKRKLLDAQARADVSAAKLQVAVGGL